MREKIIEGLRNKEVGVYPMILFHYKKYLKQLKLLNLIRLIANDLNIKEDEINKYSLRSSIRRHNARQKKKGSGS